MPTRSRSVSAETTPEMADDRVVKFPGVSNPTRGPSNGGGGGGDDLGPRVAGLEARMERMEGRLKTVEGRLTSVDDRLTRVEVKIDGIDERISDLRTDMRRVEDKALTKWDVAQVMLIVTAGISGAAFVLPRLAAILGP